jgi:CDP-diacylglycerol---glycerol-3-phosphate 3-phosphatidyltransferase
LVANLITLFRLFLLFFIFFIVDRGGLQGHIWGIFLTVVMIALDGVDGVIARWLKETSEFGGVFDIVVDRIVENCFWIFFAAKGIIPLWIPFVVLSRGFFTDGVRSVALSKGMTAFGDTSLQKSALGKTLVASKWSRGLYGFSKIAAFLSLIVLHGLSLPEMDSMLTENMRNVIRLSGGFIVYFTVAFCIVRAIPVVLDSRSFLFKAKN